MRGHEWTWKNDCLKAAWLIDSILLRNIGRRDARLSEISTEAKNPFLLAFRGWRAIISIPLYALAIFGLIGSRSIQSAQNSIIFKIVNFLSFLATVAAAGFAYIAEKTAIDSMFQSLFQ